MLDFTHYRKPHAILMLLFLGISNLIYAEGTKQLAPTASDVIQLMTNADPYYDFARYDGTDSERLYIHIADPSSEIVYLGFSRARNEITVDAPFLNAYFRIKSPDGTVVYGPTLLNAGSANMNSWQDASDGPSPLAGSGGYTPFIFDPTGLAAGDYYIEFNVHATIYDEASMVFDYWDITVASTGASAAAIDGRVFAKNWGFSAPPSIPAHPIYGNFNRPFNGAFYVYTNEQYVSKIDFNGSGFQPWAFNISLNQKGTSLTNDPAINRQSLLAGQGNNPEYPIFLNDPDNTVFPSGTFGELLTDSTSVSGCPAVGYTIKVVTTDVGIIDLLLDFDQTSGAGIYDPGTADVLIPFYMADQSSDTTAGMLTRYIPWDGLDGLGNVVNTVTPIPIKVAYSQGEYHIPIFDAEFCTNGFNTTIIRPTPPPTYILNHYFDDSQIVGGIQQFEGCTAPCHSWTDFAFGNANTINTWWYAKQEFQSDDFPVTQDCGPDSDGDGIADLIDNDLDNDGLSNSLEACDKPGPNELVITIQLDLYPGETSWTLTDASNNVLLSGSGYTVGGQLIQETYTSSDLGGLTFTINDAYGDGITWGVAGYYQLTAGDNVLGGPGNGAFGPMASLTTDSDIIYQCFDGADPSHDSDNDGIPNYQDADFCALNAAGVCASLDIDNDGIPSFLDLDSDNDGIPDIIESGRTDLNNDGMVDFNTPGDPMTMPDADGDGLADIGDPDSGGTNSYPDTDGDNVVDLWDLDSDGDGIADLVEVGGVDTDGNGMVDSMTDPVSGDTDSNGWADAIEASPLVNQSLTDAGTDFDGDGIANHLDLDADNDGITDVTESGGMDGNGDGIADDGSMAGTLTDTNTDGWEDNYDNGVITTTADGADANTIADFPTGPENPDFDGDGLPNWLDIDADNDGIVDNSEAQSTAGYLSPTTDSDNDGINDAYEMAGTIGSFGGSGIEPENTDGADSPDYLDLNTDNDGEGDLIEGHDTNGDGVVDGSDTPASNTGLATGVDADGDGLDDGFDNNVGNVEPTNIGMTPAGFATADGGADSDWRHADSDSDGIPDIADLDVDNDGIPNTQEDGNTGFDPIGDADGDGVLNYLDDDDMTMGFPAFTDLNMDGINDVYDADQDGLPDFADLDADNDGIPDIVEAGGTDTNNDGEVDYPIVGDPTSMIDGNGDGWSGSYDPGDGGTMLANPDTDNDGIADTNDLDSDGDGLADLVEVGGLDADGNGLVDELSGPGNPDADNNGWVDAYSTTPLVNQSLADAAINADDDTIPNHLDLDSDNDGITDVIESGNMDGNMDGMADDGGVVGLVIDDNNDGWDDSHDGGVTTTLPDGGNDINSLPDFPSGTGNDDFDNDGIPNWLDIDADNDGIIDSKEGQCSVGCLDLSGMMVDLNNNGVWDVFENITSMNTTGGTNIGLSPNMDDDDSMDSQPDYLDLNADADTGFDWIEGYDANMDGYAIDDLMTFADTYNANSGAVPVPFDNSADADGDNIPDWLDNLNGDGYDPFVLPPFLTPSNNLYWIDLNGNGLADIFDPSQGGTAAPTPNANGGDLDWRDGTTSISLPLELIAFSVEEKNCKYEISWITVDESNIEKIVLEKSNDGLEFEPMRSFMGQNKAMNFYEFIDAESKGLVYYRLNIISKDYSEDKSALININANCSGNNTQVTVYPNPLLQGNHLNVTYNGFSHRMEISVFDGRGKIIETIREVDTDDSKMYRLNTENYNRGMYFIQLTDGKNYITRSFVLL